MEKTLMLKIILGSTREGRFSAEVGEWVAAQAAKHPEFKTEVLDLREYEMPFFDQQATPSAKAEPYTHPAVQKWTAKIAEADAYIIVAPEYNRSMPGVLKNAIDWVYPEWNKKAVGYVAYGSTGGSRSVEHLRSAAIEQQMVPVRQAIHIPAPWTLRENMVGPLIPGSLDVYEGPAIAMFTQLKEWGFAAKTMRSSA